MACCAHMSHILDTLAGPEGDDDAYRKLIMSSMKGSPQGIRAPREKRRRAGRSE